MLSIFYKTNEFILVYPVHEQTITIKFSGSNFLNALSFKITSPSIVLLKTNSTEQIDKRENIHRSII